MSTEQRPGREMVFCHQCEEEWWKDEHGLVCPQCSSEFTEVIEQNDDPRDAPHPLDMIQQLGSIQTNWQNDRNNNDTHSDSSDRAFEAALAREMGGDADRDSERDMERDAEGLHWSPNGPNSYSVRGIVPLGGSSSTGAGDDSGRQPQQAPTRTTGGSAIGGIFGTLLNAIGGGGTQETTTTDNGTRMYNWSSSNGGMRFSMSTTTTIGGSSTGYETRSTNTGQSPIGLHQILGDFGSPSMAGAPRGDGSITDQLAVLEMILSSARMGGAPPGYANGPEDFDRIISDLMDRTAGNNGTPGADENAIESLPTKEVDKDMLGDTGKAECTICMAEVELGETVTELYCHHWFHTDCIRPWLEQHNTCPHCRMSIEAAKEAAERKAGTGNGGESSEGNQRKRSGSSSLGANRHRQYRPTPTSSNSASNSNSSSSRPNPLFRSSSDSSSSDRLRAISSRIPSRSSRLRSIRHADDIPEEPLSRGHERPAPPIPPFSPVAPTSNRHSLSDMFFSASTLSSSHSPSPSSNPPRPSHSSSHRIPPRVPVESRPVPGSYTFSSDITWPPVDSDERPTSRRSRRDSDVPQSSRAHFDRRHSSYVSNSAVGGGAADSDHATGRRSSGHAAESDGGVLSRVRNWLSGSRS